MMRAFTLSLEYFWYLWLGQNTSLTEIPRVKARTVWLPAGSPWNDKNLDYEIETNALKLAPPILEFSWNDKNLDYEIETRLSMLD